MSCVRCPMSGALVCALDHCGLCYAETVEEIEDICDKPSARMFDRVEMLAEIIGDGE